MRVEIPAYTDRWMMGDRFGTVEKTVEKRVGSGMTCEVHVVKLDKSGKTVRVPATDCKEV